MKPILFVCIALFLYAAVNVVLEQKFSGYDTGTLLAYFYVVMFPLALSRFLYVRFTKPDTLLPSGNMILIALGIGIIYFLADYFYISAFTAGGNLLVITTVFIMLPVVASVMKYLWIRELPNLYYVGAYILAVGAVFLAVKGNSVAQ